ncbi:zinc finger protein 467-like [Copidosoma floridanum]|uniref:zinc finger protein 467-like n=1 Tax=Copidosoma floridanum TaxID=29053 RepID=UPI000C6F9FC7|nr:zinc finger protein 467-like [Copidosoma floridanum]
MVFCDSLHLRPVQKSVQNQRIPGTAPTARVQWGTKIRVLDLLEMLQAQAPPTTARGTTSSLAGVLVLNRTLSNKNWTDHWQYTCERCFKNYKSRISLMQHQRRVCGVGQQFVCVVCGNRYKHKQHLKKHLSSKDEEERKHECTRCGRRYKWRKSLNVHRRNACGAEPRFVCRLCPNKRYKHKHHLKEHVHKYYYVNDDYGVIADPPIPPTIGLSSEYGVIANPPLPPTIEIGDVDYSDYTKPRRSVYRRPSSAAMSASVAFIGATNSRTIRSPNMGDTNRRVSYHLLENDFFFFFPTLFDIFVGTSCYWLFQGPAQIFLQSPLSCTIANDPLPFKCERCGRRYFRKYTLVRHLKFECGKAPNFQCEKCMKMFKHRHHLREHAKVHLDSY